MQAFSSLVSENEQWLMQGILNYAHDHGYTRYTSTLEEAWRISIRGLSSSIITAVAHYGKSPELSPEEDYTRDPVASFGILEAQRHRTRGVDFGMFLGLFKYYRQVYRDLIEQSDFSVEKKLEYQLFLSRVFDRIEIGFCNEWNALTESDKTTELQSKNRQMSNEKNKYLTIFESLDSPIILVNMWLKIENMNFEAARLFLDTDTPGSPYYNLFAGGGAEGGDIDSLPDLKEVTALEWLEERVTEFTLDGAETEKFEVALELGGEEKSFTVRLSRMKDVSGKFSGVLVLMSEITEIRLANRALSGKKDNLESIVRKRNVELDEMNMAMKAEIAERTRVQEALKESAMLWESTFDAIEDAVFLVDRNHKILQANEGLRRLTGNRDVVGKNCHEVIHGKAQPRGGCLSCRVFESGEPVHFESQEEQLGNRWIDLYAYPILDEMGGVTHTVHVLRDITLQKLSEALIKEGEQHIRSIYEAADNVAFVTTNLGAEDTAILDFSPGAEKIFGYTKNEVLGKKVAMLHKPKEARMFGMMQEAIKKGEKGFSGETTMVRKSGEPFPAMLTIHPYYDLEGHIIGTVGITIDITELRQSKTMRRETEEKFRLLFNNVNDAVFVYEIEGGKPGKFIEVNDRACEYLGYTRDELLGMSPKDVDSGNQPRKVPDIVEKIEQDGHFLFDAVHISRDGDRIPVEVSSRMFHMRGRPCIMSVARDVTERKLIEEEREKFQKKMLQTQKMEAIGQLAGGMAHDLNNMLGIIMGYAALLKEDVEDEDDELFGKPLQNIIDAATRASDLTLKLLTFSRREKVEVVTIGVKTVFERLSPMIERSIPKKIDVQTHVRQNMLVDIDENQILQTLVNICNNARDAMPGGGKLIIECDEAILGEEYCAVRSDVEPGNYCLIQVSDTGEGMTDETVQKIFEPFFTTKEAGKGTGLGMSISHGIIKNHGGSIQVYSEIGKGTAVKIFLPVSEKVSPTASSVREDSVKMGRNETVLVADDERRMLELADIMLRKSGYETILAGNGKQAVEIYRQRGKEIDLVLLDLVMPEMDGRDAFKELVKMNPDVKVVIASGYSITGQASELVKMGACRFVQKPFIRGTLCNTIRDSLDGAA